MNRDIINKVIAETASKEEAGEVIHWLSSTIEGQQCLSNLLDRDAYLMETESGTDASLSPLQSDLLYERIDRDIRNNRIRRFSFKVAAVLLPLLLVTGFGLYIDTRSDFFSKITYSEVYVPRGEDARIYFQDGTEVFLNADTRIGYPNQFGLGKREVFLEGEAYFHVASRKRRPFVVHAQNTRIEVLGTSFNVNAYNDNDKVQVVLDEGATSFHVHADTYPMTPGQQIEYDKATRRVVSRNLVNPANASLWKQNVIYFYDSPLDEVLRVLERKFNVQFHVQSPAVLNYSYTLTTKQSDIEAVLKELQKIAPVRFVVKGDTVTVSIM